MGPPPDGSPIEDKTVVVTALVAITYTWASLGIVFSIVCLIFSIVFRKRKYVLFIVYISLNKSWQDCSSDYS